MDKQAVELVKLAHIAAQVEQAAARSALLGRINLKQEKVLVFQLKLVSVDVKNFLLRKLS